MGVRRYYVGKKKELSEDYFEVPYDELIENGDATVLKRGTEDFSGQRLGILWLWDLKRPTGKLNRGGKRMWETIDSIYAKNHAEAKEILRYFYPDQEIQMVRIRRGYVFRLE